MRHQPPAGPEIRPCLAETFDLHARVDGFEGTIVHLPIDTDWLHLSQWARRRRAQLGQAAVLAAGVGYMVSAVLVLWTAPMLSALVLVGGAVAADIAADLAVDVADDALDRLEPAGRRVEGMVSRAVQKRSRLRLDASRLHLNSQSWPLHEVEQIESEGSTVTIRIRDRRPVVLFSDHSPWACRQLCQLVNAQVAGVHQAVARPPEALTRIRQRVSDS